MEEIRIDHWSEFDAKVREFTGLTNDDAEDGGPRRSEPTLFRGLGNSSWGLETTLERSYPSERSDSTMSLLKYYAQIWSARPAIEVFGRHRWERLPDPPAFKQLLQQHWSRWLDLIL
jgi:hypothetical protein